MASDDNNTNNDEWVSRTSTEWNACSLEVLRNNKIDTKTKIPLVIGCYQLEETTPTTSNNNKVENKQRNGQLRLYNISKSEGMDGCVVPFETKESPVSITEMESGVLDAKWFPSTSLECSRSLGKNGSNNGDDDDGKEEEGGGRYHVLATACASGKLHLHGLYDDDADADDAGMEAYPSARLEHLASSTTNNNNNDDVDDESSNGICLSLDWNNGTIDSSNGRGEAKIVSSYSNGELAIHTVDLNRNQQQQVLEETHRWNAHSLFGNTPTEVWTCCWANNNNNDQSNMVISGADDCKLKGFDLRMPLSIRTAIFCVGEEEHEAGVTAVSWHPTEPNVFASGSYDEGVRLWDIRTMGSNKRHCKPVDKISSCGGGIWRLRWHPTDKAKILVAAMHGGCRVLHVPALEGGAACSSLEDSDAIREHYQPQGKQQPIDVVSSFTAHRSMAYGADWLSLSLDDCSTSCHRLAASCSFYDQQAFIWDTQTRL